MNIKNSDFLILAVLVTMSMQCFVGCAAVNDPEHIEATNPTCSIKEPPPRAGEYVGEGGFQRVDPRGADMPPNFNGCQSVWYEKENGWALAYRLLLQDGKVKKLITPSFECSYENDQEAPTNSADCPKKVPTIAESLPYGCLSAPLSNGKHPCLISTKSWPPENSAPSPKVLLETCSINDIVLIAPMPSFRGAIMRCPDSPSYFPKVGDLVGREKAKISQIAETSITMRDSAGAEKKINVSTPPHK